jgi:hypothetical protein
MNCHGSVEKIQKMMNMPFYLKENEAGWFWKKKRVVEEEGSITRKRKKCH